VRPFDPAAYLKEVLAPYVGSAEAPGLFERYLLDPDDDDDRAIEARLREVKALWDKRAEQPKYGSLIRLLIGQHTEASLTLGDGDARRKESAKAAAQAAERTAAQARSAHEWEQLVREVTRGDGALDAVRRARLEKAAVQLGVSAGDVRARLDGIPEAELPQALDESRRAEVRRALAALAQDVEEPRVSLSLFHALGLPEITLDRGEIETLHEQLVRANGRRSHGNTKTLYATVLTHVKLLLLDGDPRVYLEGLLLDVRDQLSAEATRAAVNDGVIDQVEAEQLIQRALGLGLPRVLADRVLVEVGKEYGVPIRVGAAVDYVACPTCNRAHPRERAPEVCDACGAPLFVVCAADGCAVRNDALAPRCTGCGADLGAQRAALRVVARLPALLEAGRIRQAEQELAPVHAVLGAVPGAEPLAQRVEQAMRSARASWTRVEAELAERRVYAAAGLLRALRRDAVDVAGPDGSTPADRLAVAERRVQSAEQALARARRAAGDAREAALVEAVGFAADCHEAQRALDEIPPAPPSHVAVAIGDRAVEVEWAASPTAGVAYEVRRGGAEQLVASDVTTTRLADPAPAAGELVAYAVVALRGRSRSAAARSRPQVVAREVAGLEVSSGDSLVRLSWAPVGRDCRVLVERSDESAGETRTLASNVAGLIDRDVRNGRTYRYEVAVEYRDGAGAAVRTSGRSVFAQPATPPEPVAALAAVQDGDTLRLSFPAPAVGTVAILRCGADPGVEPGALLELGALAELGEALSFDGPGACDRASGTGTCWYLPVSVSGGIAVAGAALRHLRLPPIENVAALELANGVRLTWSWPDGVRVAAVVWREDRQPTGPEDPDARVRHVRVGEYRDGGGVTIDVPSGRSLFATVYPAARVDGVPVSGVVAGRGSRVSLRRVERTDVRYAVRRTGLRRRRLEVEVVEPELAPLPPLVLVARPGELLPRHADDGEVVARLGEDGPRCSTLDLAGRTTPLVVRLFLGSSTAEATHRLFDPAPDQLLVR
jgi:hypothetical protein